MKTNTRSNNGNSKEASLEFLKSERKRPGPIRTEQVLRERYPCIDWNEPIIIRNFGMKEAHYACRYCIALKGMKGTEVEKLPTDPEEVRKHIREAHTI